MYLPETTPSFRSDYEKNEKKLKNGHYSYSIASGSLKSKYLVEIILMSVYSIQFDHNGFKLNLLGTIQAYVNRVKITQISCSK